jgi:signal transduction histidine kinase
LRGESVDWFGVAQGIPNDYVSQILTDDEGTVWLAGNQGIFKVASADFEDVAQGHTTRVSPVVYGRNEGMLGLQASFDFQPSALRSSEDRLFFSTLTGLAEVRLNHLWSNPRPPQVFIERVLADGEPQTVYPRLRLHPASEATKDARAAASSGQRVIRLPPGRQLVQFEFTGLSFAAPERTRFRYQLEGLDHGWVEAGARRVADYTHLPPGRYVFKVIACNQNGVWSKVGDSLGVIVAPHFWETLWFKLGMVGAFSLACSGLVMLVLRRRHRLQLQHIEQERLVDRERARISRDLHDDLGVRLTEIGLLGDLAGAPAVTPQTSREYLREITAGVRGMAGMLDEIVWALNPVNDTSQSVTDYFSHYAQKLLQRASIRCRLEILEPLPRVALNAEQKHQLFLAFKESLNNVIRHSDATEVRVGLGANNGHWQVRVTDNGHGFDAGPGEGSPDGLAGMQDRLRRLGGRCEVSSKRGAGTSVTLLVPIRNPHAL